MVLRPQRLGQPAHEVELAGDGLQLGAVADADHRAHLVLAPVGRRRAQHQHLLPEDERLVDDRRAPLDGRDQPRRQPELGERAPLHLGRQREQPHRLVVDQLHAQVGVDQQQALADGAEHGAVVLVHPGDLALAEPVGLAAQPPRDQPGPEQAGQQRRDGRDEDPRQVVEQALVDPVDRDAHGHQGDHPVVGHDGDHGPYGRAERARVDLGEHAALQGVADAADEAAADLGGVGVGPADPVAVHDHDEVGVGVDPDLLGERLQGCGGVRRADLLAHERGVRDRAGHGRGLVARRVAQVTARVEGRQRDGGDDEDDDDTDLQQQDLAGHRALAVGASRHGRIVPHRSGHL